MLAEIMFLMVLLQVMTLCCVLTRQDRRRRNLPLLSLEDEPQIHERHSTAAMPNVPKTMPDELQSRRSTKTEEVYMCSACFGRDLLSVNKYGMKMGIQNHAALGSLREEQLECIQDGLVDISEGFVRALTTCEYAKSWKRVIYLLKDMKERKIKVEPARFRSAFWNGILTAEMEQDVEEAFDLFQQMKENKLYVEDFMYEKVIRILERGGQLARATAVDQEFRDMQMGQYNKELKIHRSRNEWQEAIGVLDAIRADGLTPTLNVTNSAMSALQKPGKWELVLTLMSEMRWEGNLPDFCSHTVAISAMLSAGELARAVKHLEEMQQQGIEPTALTYGRVIFALEANGHPEMALHLWDQMRRKEIEPDRVGYEAAIRACHRCEYWEAVLELFGEMQEKDKFASKVSRQSAAVAAERLGLASSVTEGATLTA
ncbi:unnamed protein product [Durusdinium trenchii]|uniref:Pentatricopeptide repeat-containing protein n=1 Tax=Durusdinium trenchii TaxID=1381693 RepID=A0ABP0QC79_9DINO